MTGELVRGRVLHCSRFGAVVRLTDGRLALLPSDQPGYATVRQAASAGRRPDFDFLVEADGRRCQLTIARREGTQEPRRSDTAASGSLEQKIIDYLRQTAEWDPRINVSENRRGDEAPRANRLLPFEQRARRQSRESPERPRKRRS